MGHLAASKPNGNPMDFDIGIPLGKLAALMSVFKEYEEQYNQSYPTLPVDNKPCQATTHRRSRLPSHKSSLSSSHSNQQRMCLSARKQVFGRVWSNQFLLQQTPSSHCLVKNLVCDQGPDGHLSSISISTSGQIKLESVYESDIIEAKPIIKQEKVESTGGDQKILSLAATHPAYYVPQATHPMASPPKKQKTEASTTKSRIDSLVDLPPPPRMQADSSAPRQNRGVILLGPEERVEPKLWHKNNGMCTLMQDTDIGVGNVISPRPMIALPFGMMIETAHFYPDGKGEGMIG